MTAAERFVEARPRLIRLAYSELGDVGEAEDVVQEAWLRLERADAEAIENLDGWLTTVVARLALDRLQSARARRETYVGPWLPEPLVSDDPADRVTLDESVSYALLAVLEQLSPAERTAFVLHDVFDMPFGDVGEVVGRTPEAVRQLASRARRHVARERPRFAAPREEHDRAVRAFARAVAEGDLEGLVAVLDPDVVWTSDGGGRATAALRPLRGGARVARAWSALSRRSLREPIEISLNGELGLLLASADGHRSVLSFGVSDGRITRVDAVRNPEKLRRLSATRRSVSATAPMFSSRWATDDDPLADLGPVAQPNRPCVGRPRLDPRRDPGLRSAYPLRRPTVAPNPARPPGERDVGIESRCRASSAREGTYGKGDEMTLARVVAFEGVTASRIDELRGQIEGQEPTPDLPATEVMVLVDREAEKSLAVVFFANEEDYRRGDAFLDAMPAPDTPGRRTSVTKYEVAIRQSM